MPQLRRCWDETKNGKGGRLCLFAFFFWRFGPEMLSVFHVLVEGPTDHAEGTQCAHMF